MALTMGGLSPVVKETVPPPADDPASSPVLMFLRLVALNIEIRRELARAVRRHRNLAQQIDDPQMADHPGRDTAIKTMERRQQQEHDHAQRLLESNVAIARQWDVISPEDKNRYGLTHLLGVSDPCLAGEQEIIQVLWRNDRGIARLAPFPQNWWVPGDMIGRAYDTRIDIVTYTAEELWRSTVAPF